MFRVSMSALEAVLRNTESGIVCIMCVCVCTYVCIYIYVHVWMFMYIVYVCSSLRYC